MNTERFICIDNQGYPAALELFATYESVSDEQAEKRGLIRVIDESGEDYLYPKSRFVSADITPDMYAALPEDTKKILAQMASNQGESVDLLTGRRFSAEA